MVLYNKLFFQHCDCIVDKVTALIIVQTSRTSKPSDNVLEDKSSSCIYRIVLNCLFFSPSCKVINCGDDVSSL
jgi:hypothetical protein